MLQLIGLSFLQDFPTFHKLKIKYQNALILAFAVFHVDAKFLCIFLIQISVQIKLLQANYLKFIIICNNDIAVTYSQDKNNEYITVGNKV